MAKTKKNQLQATVIKLLVLVIVLAASVVVIGQKTHAAIQAKEIQNRLMSLENNTQVMKLRSGWNLVSLYVIPSSLAVEEVFASLTTSGALETVKNNAGHVYWPKYNINQIGDVVPSQGYWVNLTRAATLVVSGNRVSLPTDIPLSAGWNIMAFPARRAQNALNVVNSLIQDNVLTVVEDLNHNQIKLENGQWVNHIGNMVPGRAYLIHVTTDAVLQIH